MNAHALKQWWGRVGFEQAGEVERRLLVGSLTGGALALVTLLLLPRSGSVEVVVLCAALLGSLVALPSHSRLLMGLGGVAVLIAAFAFGVSASRAPYVLSAALGVVLAAEPQSRLRRVVSLFGPSLGVWWFSLVVRWLSARHLGAASVLGIGAQLSAGLFISIGAVLSFVRVAVDEVEPRLIEPKVRAAWLRLHQARRKLREPVSKAKLRDVANAVASRWLDARMEQDDVGALDESQRAGEAREAIEALTARLDDTEDAELRRHFEQSLRVHKDVLEQLEGLSRKKERAEARARAEADWLDTAAFTLELTPATALAERDAVDRLAILARRGV